MKALRLRWLSRGEQVQQYRLMSMLLSARLKYGIIIASDVTRLGISQVHSFDSSLQLRFLAIPSTWVSPLYLLSLWTGLGSRSSLHTPLVSELPLKSSSINILMEYGGLKVLLEDPFGATSAPSELFRLFYQRLYSHYHYHGLSDHLTP
jgi:hypothetical protein